MILFLLMQVIKYFEQSTTTDRGCSTRGTLHCDAIVASGLRKRYGDLSRAQIEQSLMTSYKNRCATLSNVTVTSTGKIFRNGHRIGQIVVCSNFPDAEENKYIDDRQHDLVVSISGVWSWGIWHFPCESFCALINTGIPTDAKIHVNAATNYVRSWLKLIGIEDDRIIHGTVKAKTLIVPEQGACASPYPEQIDWLTNICRQDTELLPFRLLILSKRTKSRGWRNFKQVENVCVQLAQKLGLRLYLHDDSNLPSLKDQQRAFRNASIVVAPHGGGNVHILAMDEGTTLIEVMSVTHIERCFLRLAVYRNINYYGVNSVNGVVDLNSLIDVCEKISNK